MNTAAKVEQMMNEWRAEGIAQTIFVSRLANACIGWCYIFGDRGEYCTPSHRKTRYNSHPEYPNLIDKCQVLKKGKADCAGCKWHPGDKTRAFDCRGFTYWLFMQIGIKIEGAGATSQYNNNNNWSEKGPIENMPKDKICCVFRYNSSTRKYEHTLFYDGDGHYIHDNGEVRKVAVSKYKATHYAIPKGLYNTPRPAPEPTPTPTPTPEPTPVKRNTLRKGYRGKDVKEMQELLLKAGYKLPKYGADGSFGNETLAAVKAFQKDHKLAVDGVVGKNTWAALLNQ